MAVSVGALLERERELATVEAMLDGAAGGAGGALLVSGPPGLGKSALAAAAAERARACGLVVGAAAGAELERLHPYGVARRLLDGLMDAEPVAGAATLDRLVALAGRTPLLVVVDDAQWVDRASLRCLERLAERARASPLALLVLTERVEAVESVSASRLVLAPLSEAAAGELARAALGEAAQPAVVAACHEVTGGNPFLLRALLGALVAGDVARTAGAIRGASGVWLERRVTRLGPAAVGLARALAILGGEADEGDACALAALDEPAAREAADALATAGLLALGRPLRFVHPLVRAAVYEAIAPAERAEGHRRAAALLDARAPERVVGHLMAIPSAGDAWALTRLNAAAEQARRLGDLDTARALLERALGEAPAGDDRARVLLGLATVERRSRDAGAVSQLETALALAREPQLRAEIARELFDARLVRGDGDAARSILEWARRELPDPAGGSWLELEASRVALMQLPVSPGEAAALIGRLGRFEHANEDSPAQRRLLALLAFHRFIWGQTTAAEVGRLAARALAGGEPIEEEGIGYATFAALSVLQGVERDDELEACLERAALSARARGEAWEMGVLLVLRGRLALFRGRLADAERDLREGLELSEATGLRVTVELGLAGLVSVLVERGELDCAEGLLSREDLAGEGSGNRYLLLQARAGLRRAQGRAAEAARDLRAADRHRSGPAGASVLSRAMLALAADAAGEREVARRVAGEAVERAERWAVPGTLGIALRAQGLIERGPRGLALLERAEAALAASPRRLEHARALVDLGAARRRAGDPAGARRALLRGLPLAQRCGATPLAARARDELLAVGERQ